MSTAENLDKLNTIDETSQSNATEEMTQPQKRGMSFGSIFLIAAIVLVGVVIAVQLARQSAGQPTSGVAPDFSLTTFDGQELRLSDLRGKVVFINFWASWCGPCRDEAPELRAAWEQYQVRDDVIFIGIAYADRDERSLEFLDEFGITYPNGPDLGTRISDMYAIRGVPESFVIGKDGKIVEFIYAGVTQARLNQIINPLLEG
ncbi:MAG: TlpA family protein disulfide reductase [Anaerolineae bacterium]|nr:TlpA family protein disulfide reductase [Anaerolineae bacterium]